MAQILIVSQNVSAPVLGVAEGGEAEVIVAGGCSFDDCLIKLGLDLVTSATATL